VTNKKKIKIEINYKIKDGIKDKKNKNKIKREEGPTRNQI